MREGLPLPQRLENAPSLLPGLELYYMGFMDLMASRQVGFSVGPIWWETVQKYCETYRLGEEQTEDMHYHIRNLDTVYLDYQQKK